MPACLSVPSKCHGSRVAFLTSRSDTLGAAARDSVEYRDDDASLDSPQLYGSYYSDILTEEDFDEY